jgi:hypothetical protein
MTPLPCTYNRWMAVPFTNGCSSAHRTERPSAKNFAGDESEQFVLLCAMFETGSQGREASLDVAADDGCICNV